MKIALAIPRIDSKYEKFGLDVDWGWWAPLGLLAVASFIKKNIPDIDILILDEQIIDHAKMVKSIKEFSPDWLGISPDYLTYENSLDLAKLGKAQNAKVVFGGHYATNLGETMLMNRPEIDYVVMQNGEQAMYDLICGKPSVEIANLIWRYGARIVKNKVEFANLDLLPSINYDLLDLQPYFDNYKKNQTERKLIQPFQKPLTFTSQRGCRWREISKGCLFCSCIYAKWQGRNPSLVWQDVMNAKDKYGVDSMIFGEDDFLSSSDWFGEFFNKRPKGDRPGIRFAYTNACALNRESVKRLAELQCYQVFVGFESASDDCLRQLHKEARLENLLKAAELLYEFDIRFNASFALGVPGENNKTLDSTYALAEKLKTFGANGFNAYPLLTIPGSKAWKRAMNEDVVFFQMNHNQDVLEPDVMVKLWIEHFCSVGVDEVIEVCEKINNLFFHNWNFDL